MNREQWLEDRRKGIGSSDAAAVCNLSPWGTPYSVYLDKTGQLPPRPINAALAWGARLEDVIADAFQEETGRKVKRTADPIVRHKEIEWLFASLDRVTEDDAAVVECKAVNAFRLDDWGEPGTDQIPEHYLLQVQHQLAVTGLQTAYLAALIGGQDLRVYCLERNDTAIQFLLAIEAEFWKCVEERRPPEPSWKHPSTSRLIAGLYGVDESLAVDLGEEAEMLLRAYQDHGEVIGSHKEGREEAKARLLYLMGEAHLARLPGGTLLTRRQVRRKGYAVEATSYVDFRIKKGKVKA